MQQHRRVSVYMPAEYGSCFSMNSNSFRSYLALIHCSLRSLQVKGTEHLVFTLANKIK